MASRMVAYFSDHLVVSLPVGHRFPMLKYARTRATLQAEPSLAHCLELRPAPLASMQDLLRVHDHEYIKRFWTGQLTTPEMRNVGFPWSKSLVARTFSSTGGTVQATRHVLDGKGLIAANVAGGTHHAFADRGEGFCIFNDIAVAAAMALDEYGLQCVLVVDLDVHQGNGTAAIFEADPRVTTFDMHGDNNYPWRSRMKNTHDVPLPDGTGDEEYLGLLRQWLPRLFSNYRPQLLLFQAGVDALKGDGFGLLALSRQGLIERNNLVYSAALQHRVPLVVCMGGGYSRPIEPSVDAHVDVYRIAAYRHWAAQQAPLRPAAAATAAA